MNNFPKNIKAVFFDLDDTILDRSKTFEHYCKDLINKFFPKNISYDEDIITQIKEYDKNGYEASVLSETNIIMIEPSGFLTELHLFFLSRQMSGLIYSIL